MLISDLSSDVCSSDLIGTAMPKDDTIRAEFVRQSVDIRLAHSGGSSQHANHAAFRSERSGFYRRNGAPDRNIQSRATHRHRSGGCRVEGSDRESGSTSVHQPTEKGGPAPSKLHPP